jgi:hypothetical protein
MENRELVFLLNVQTEERGCLSEVKGILVEKQSREGEKERLCLSE